MSWKPEYAQRRREKAATDPVYRAKRNAQACSDPIARAEYMKQYFAANPEKFRRTPAQAIKRNAKKREAYAVNPEVRAKACAETREWQRKNPAKRKSQRLKKYGLTLAGFASMLASQGGGCAVCGHADRSDPKFFPVVDHCHKTGKVRGLLCMNCNMGLGKFADDPKRLTSAIAYLASHPAASLFDAPALEAPAAVTAEPTKRKRAKAAA